MISQRIVYKVCDGDEWTAASRNGHYEGSADDRRDGFIHLSTAAQLPGTLARHFQGRSGLLLLGFETAALGLSLRWEPSRGGELFPHLYAPLPVAAASCCHPLPLGPEGMPRLPADLDP